MKAAPLFCPKCGEEKGWVCTDHPDTPWFEYSTEKDTVDYQPGDGVGESIAANVVILLVKAIFHGIKKAFVHAKPIHYRCKKCGFKGTYKQD